ncbi:MAG: hypothetical protein ACXVCY_02410 [Pseudobdellovibrionaceae bacterium]
MLIDVIAPEKWEELNDKVKSFLGLKDLLRARSYRGLNHAVFEISLGTAQFFSHKKAVGFILGQSSAFESLVSYCYKETYEVQSLSHLQVGNVSEWVDSLKKETNFVLFSEDHPVTGELYPFADELDRLLNDKRIYSFRISHFHHLQVSNEVLPYTVRLCSFSAHAAVAVLGERFRSPPMLAQNMSWDQPELFLEELSFNKLDHPTNRSLIEKFELEMQSVANPYFKMGTPRIYDRAVCVFEDVNAEAVAQVLFKKLGFSSEDGWKKVSTTSLCHWSTVKMFQNWWEPRPSMEQLRGLIVFSADLLSIKDFAMLVISSYEEVKAQQSWNL